MDLLGIRSAIAEGKNLRELPLRVAFYARVSTEKEEQLSSLRNQREYYTAYIKENAHWHFAGGYVDEGIGGGSVRKREEFLRMIRDGEAGRFDFIVTKEISRFSRDTLDSIRFTRRLLDCGVGVYFQNDGINTLMPDAELRLTIMASLAQDERRRLSERVRFGFRRSIEAGHVLGNGAIWGYEKDNCSLRVNEAEARMVREVFRLYVHEKLGLRAISARLAQEGFLTKTKNPLSMTTVKSILQNPKYMGTYCGSKTTKVDYRSGKVRKLDPAEWKLVPDHERVPAIVSRELWQQANDILACRRERQAAKQPANLCHSYSGKVFCGADGAPYYRAVYHYPSGDREVWQCRNYVTGGRAACRNPNLYTDEADEALMIFCRGLPAEGETLAEKLLAAYRAAAERDAGKQSLQKLQKKREELAKKRERLCAFALDGTILPQEFRERAATLSREAAELERRMAAAERESAALLQEGDIYAAIREELAFQSGATQSLRDGLVEKITVFGSNTENERRAEIVFVGCGEARRFTVTRVRGEKTSVRCASYT